MNQIVEEMKSYSINPIQKREDTVNVKSDDAFQSIANKEWLKFQRMRDAESTPIASTLSRRPTVAMMTGNETTVFHGEESKYWPPKMPNAVFAPKEESGMRTGTGIPNTVNTIPCGAYGQYGDQSVYWPPNRQNEIVPQNLNAPKRDNSVKQQYGTDVPMESQIVAFHHEDEMEHSDHNTSNDSQLTMPLLKVCIGSMVDMVEQMKSKQTQKYSELESNQISNSSNCRSQLDSTTMVQHYQHQDVSRQSQVKTDDKTSLLLSEHATGSVEKSRSYQGTNRYSPQEEAAAKNSRVETVDKSRMIPNTLPRGPVPQVIGGENEWKIDAEEIMTENAVNQKEEQASEATRNPWLDTSDFGIKECEALVEHWQTSPNQKNEISDSLFTFPNLNFHIF